MHKRLFSFSPLACLLLVLPASPATAVEHRFFESFDTKQYCDIATTTALWDTVAGELKLPPFELTLTGTYNTDGNARGLAVEGNYAFIADNLFGLQIINITNPASPTLAGTYNTPGNARGVTVDGNYAFVADMTSGVIVVSITNPASPTLAGSYDTPGSARDVIVDGNFAYVADYGSGLVILNVTNPASPTLAGSYDTPGSAQGVAIAGNYAYVADGSSGLQVINITNPASPTLAGTYDTPGTAYDVAIDGDRAYIADYDGGLQVINIANPAAPTYAGSLSTADNAFGVAVGGDRAYVAAAGAGFLEIGIFNPEAPALARSYDTTGNAYAVAFDGNQAFIADDLWGLQIIKITSLTPPYRMGWYTPVGADAQAVAVDGEFAYMACRTSGLIVVDIRLFGLFTSEGSYNTTGSAEDVAIAGDIAYVADGASGLQVISISNPASPTLTGTYNTTGTAYGVAVAGDYALVADLTSGLQVINIANPASPTLAGTYDTPGLAYDVAVSGDYAFVADASGLIVVNITNPASPTLAGSYDTPGTAYDVRVAGDAAFVADGAGGLQIINISNPASPTLLGSYNTPGSANGVAVAGDCACVADGTGGFSSINIANPGSPTLVGSWSLGDVAIGVALFGDFAFVATSFDGFQVVRWAQRAYSETQNYGNSTVVASTPDLIRRVRFSTTHVDSIRWAVSADDGVHWAYILPNWSWNALSFPGSSLRWRSAHEIASGGVANPVCSDLTFEWLLAPATIDSVRDIAGDQGGKVRVYFTRSAFDFAGEATAITTYNVWRRVDDAALAQEAPQTATEIAIPAGAKDGARAASVDSGTFGDLPVFARNGRLFVASNPALAAAGMPPGTWEVMGSFSATQQDQYIYPTLTVADSTVEQGSAWAVYMVTAHTATPSVWYASAPDSGQSVDNIAPGVPAGFLAAPAGLAVDLDWQPSEAPDFQYFRIYRGAAPDFPIGPTSLVHETAGLAWTDPGPGTGTVYYKLTALDHAGNEGAPATASVDMAVGAEDSFTPAVFALLRATPNPFSRDTVIRFDVPAPGGAVRLGIYHVSGRLVRTLADGVRAPGRHGVSWDGRDEQGRPASAGVYFYRMEAPGFTQTRKVVLGR